MTINDINTKIESLLIKKEFVNKICKDKDSEYALNWDITFENMNIHIDYHVGIGHYFDINRGINGKEIVNYIYKDIKKFQDKDNIVAITIDNRNLYGYIRDKKIKCKLKSSILFGDYIFNIAKPNNKEIIYSLYVDASAYINSIDFKDFAYGMGLSDDSIRAKKSYDACKEAFLNINKLGFNLSELDSVFENF